MKFKATLLSFIFIFATVFAGARSFMSKSEDCCKTSHCDTKKKEKGCDQKDNCAKFCCISIVAVKSPALLFPKNNKAIFSKNRIFQKDDNKINNHGLPFFHPPSQI